MCLKPHGLQEGVAICHANAPLAMLAAPQAELDELHAIKAKQAALPGKTAVRGEAHQAATCVIFPVLTGSAGALLRLQAHRQQLAPVLVAMLNSAEEACPAGRAAAVPGPRTEGIPVAALAKEGVYNAVGTCSYELHDFLDFPAWFRNALAVVRIAWSVISADSLLAGEWSCCIPRWRCVAHPYHDRPPRLCLRSPCGRVAVPHSCRSQLDPVKTLRLRRRRARKL